MKRAGGSFFVRAELGRELLLRSAYEPRGRRIQDRGNSAANGDNRVLAPALRDYGKALEYSGQGRPKRWFNTIIAAGDQAGESGVRREIGSQ